MKGWKIRKLENIDKMIVHLLVLYAFQLIFRQDDRICHRFNNKIHGHCGSEVSLVLTTVFCFVTDDACMESQFNNMLLL